ncbi:uncharacterized protein LOC134239909 [Saccostrea cucullata]|uniref:uncharacterized protein LOC134239909 n=1 Tax=Saccostrea cuccullata TaxID=36930 RepID=UPI002ED4FC2F
MRKVNAVGVAKRNLSEVKDKWRNMCREAKMKFTENRRQMTKTGGGPPPTPLSQTMQDVVDMYKDASSFHGIEGGIETSMPGCSVISSMAVSPTQTVTNRITKDHDVDIWQDACEDLPVPSQSPGSHAFIVMESTPLEEPLSPPRQLCASSLTLSMQAITILAPIPTAKEFTAVKIASIRPKLTSKSLVALRKEIVSL